MIDFLAVMATHRSAPVGCAWKVFAHGLASWAMGLMALTWLAVPAIVSAQPQAQQLPAEHLEQLVAPIALYPDSLVAQILMASTYPLEIVQAQRWRKQNASLEGQALEQALVSQDWDPSIKALTNFPSVLERMSDNLDWAQDLGDAVLAQQEDVMDAVQRMRRYAYDAGNLQSTPEQKVIVEEKIIVVQPAAEVVYVPSYSPTVIYGSVWVPHTYYYPFYSYPPTYWYPPGYAAAQVIAFGVAVGVSVAIWNNWNWGRCDWRGRGVTINNNFNFSRNRNINTGNINIGNKVGGSGVTKWEHNSTHRRSVRYRNESTSRRYERNATGSGSRIDRDAARGREQPAARERVSPQAGTGTRDASRPRASTGTRDASRPRASTDTRDSARPQTGAASANAARSNTAARTSGAARSRAQPAPRQSSAFDMNAGGRAASSRGARSRSGATGGARRR